MCQQDAGGCQEHTCHCCTVLHQHCHSTGVLTTDHWREERGRDGEGEGKGRDGEEENSGVGSQIRVRKKRSCRRTILSETKLTREVAEGAYRGRGK